MLNLASSFIAAPIGAPRNLPPAKPPDPGAAFRLALDNFKAKGLSPAAAMREAVKRYPEAHALWLQAVNRP